MKLLILLVSLMATTAMAQNVNVIPQPLNVETGTGYFIITSKTKIIADASNCGNAIYLQKMLEPAFKKGLELTSKGAKGIVLKLDENLADEIGSEGYLFEVGKKAIKITASNQAGVFYGIQTLKQLLPLDLNEAGGELSVSTVKIKDQPRFSWRAFMLDEARYFKGMDQVKKLLDQMALLKMNVFHWHLTDDQGWRIEIKKYPKLTRIGSTREDSQIGGWNSKERSGKSHSGFYTQNQIKEIIAYATERHINIVPEIEMPGHASAAIAAYPWLGTIGELKETPVVFGKLPDSYNVSDPRVYTFIEDVLSEVMALFPGKTIHIGGDEVKFDAWKESEEVQAFMKEKGLASPADLQIFFTNKVSNFIDKKEHRMMGWNEILGGNVHEWQKAEDVEVKEKLATSAIIHFWKGNLDLINDAVKKGYDIVNSYHMYTYLDYSHNYIPLEKAYAFDPIPEGLDKKYHAKVLGSGCQMWGEWIPEVSDMDRMVFPRLAAYAEVGWTAKERKQYSVFGANLKHMLERWKKEGIGYADKFEKKDFSNQD
ncbi:beta-N-acetylhexosaminidase [Ancylomarina euxinus]|nr:beta-N-acetylhexosaminidase [Ancylomarina euxinus]MCZ4696194.1 beta-N-acetylhexosaminidase [Ancylomarina euxinus]